MKLNNVVWVVTKNKQAIYINNTLLFSGEHGSAMNNIGNIIISHNATNAEHIFCEGIDLAEFPKNLNALKEKIQ